MTEEPYRAYCEKRKAEGLFRALRETESLPGGKAAQGGKVFVNFSSNDYLGLSRHPEIIRAAQEAAACWGAGSTSSRLIAGENPLYADIEGKIARGKGTEAALVLCSGYQANITALAALADSEAVGKPVAILADRLCHNSLLQGALLSGARLTRFRHNDLGHLVTLLEQQKDKDNHVIIVTESVFGMDGDRADLARLIEIKKSYGAMLYVDEAHATGLFGPNGFGLASEHKGQVDVIMGTFGKALGSFGAYIASSSILRDYLIQRCGGFIYSTGLPPPTLASIDAALDLLPRMEKERAYLQQQSARLREALMQGGWDCGASTTHIIPVLLGGEDAATDLAESLGKHGMLAPAIRPPTVPAGTSRLRISLSSAHSESDINKLIDLMNNKMTHYRQAMAS